MLFHPLASHALCFGDLVRGHALNEHVLGLLRVRVARLDCNAIKASYGELRGEGLIDFVLDESFDMFAEAKVYQPLSDVVGHPAGIVRLTGREPTDPRRSRLSRCKLTPFGQSDRSVLLEDIAAV